MRTVLIALVLLATLSTQVGGDPLFVEENVIFFDTENSSTSKEIEFGQREQLLKILENNPGIDTLVLNSSGGMISEAKEIADLVIDANLNTHVEHFCESACVTIFLAGQKRTLALGGKIGFHSNWWDATSMEKYYQSEKQHMGWDTPFDFASWLYEDTQSEIFLAFEYLLERGVKPDFAIQTLKAGSDGMWYPRRSNLQQAGIVTK